MLRVNAKKANRKREQSPQIPGNEPKEESFELIQQKYVDPRPNEKNPRITKKANTDFCLLSSYFNSTKWVHDNSNDYHEGKLEKKDICRYFKEMLGYNIMYILTGLRPGNNQNDDTCTFEISRFAYYKPSMLTDSRYSAWSKKNKENMDVLLKTIPEKKQLEKIENIKVAFQRMRNDLLNKEELVRLGCAYQQLKIEAEFENKNKNTPKETHLEDLANNIQIAIYYYMEYSIPSEEIMHALDNEDALKNIKLRTVPEDAICRWIVLDEKIDKAITEANKKAELKLAAQGKNASEQEGRLKKSKVFK